MKPKEPALSLCVGDLLWAEKRLLTRDHKNQTATPLLPRNKLGSKQQLVVAGTFKSSEAEVQPTETRSEMLAAERAPSVLPESLQETESFTRAFMP